VSCTVVVLTCFVMCGFFNVCVCVLVICILVFTVLLYCIVYVDLILFVCVLVLEYLPPSDN